MNFEKTTTSTLCIKISSDQFCIKDLVLLFERPKLSYNKKKPVISIDLTNETLEGLNKYIEFKIRFNKTFCHDDGIIISNLIKDAYNGNHDIIKFH